MSLLSRVIFYISDEMILAYVADVKKGEEKEEFGRVPFPFKRLPRMLKRSAYAGHFSSYLGHALFSYGPNLCHPI